MSYGIEIINNNNRILVDESYPHITYVSTTASSESVGAMNNLFTGNASEQTGDLVLARAANGVNGHIGRGNAGTPPNGPYWPQNAPGQYITLANTVNYYLVRNMAGQISKATSGYGMEVYGSNGNDVYFTSNISKGLDIVETGIHNSYNSGVKVIRYPSSGTLSDLNKYYCSINNTFVNNILIPGFPTSSVYSYAIGYEYVWSTSTTGYININAYVHFGSTSSLTTNIDFRYIIFKELS